MDSNALLAFLRDHRLAVPATTSATGGPQAAVVGIAVTNRFEVVDLAYVVATRDGRTARARVEDVPMPKLIVLYPTPLDEATFERRYTVEHAPMVSAKVPGLKKFVAARVLGTPTGVAPYQRVAELYFDSTEALQSAMASPGGQLTVAHAMEISTGGPPVVLIAEDDQPV
jgi:uncharacterized protein (TIGR02118 family)